MPLHEVRLTARAEDSLAKLTARAPDLARRLMNAMEQLGRSPYDGKALGGKLKGLLSCRAGDYRIIYQCHPARLVVLVIDVGHRRDIYR